MQIQLIYILLAVESITLFYLMQLQNQASVGALAYSNAVWAVGLTLIATLLLMASQTLPSKKAAPKKPAKKHKRK